ncbi:hypothetical protein CGQ24_11995 [Arthrobacter sp. 7749]|nr:hypothetical protein CGQ24_11995 [Arthrobacter sp. 7749]
MSIPKPPGTSRASIVARTVVAMLLASLLSIFSLAPVQAAGPTENESNDSTATANVLKLGTTYTASTMGGDYDNDDDYFAVDLPSAGRMSLNLKFPANLGTESGYDVSVLNSEGDELYDFEVSASQYSGAWLASQGMYLPKGRFYVYIHGSYSRETWGKNYTLSVGHAPGNVETEYNDTTATSDVVKIGTTYSGSALSADGYDDDYFAVDIPSNGRTKINFRFPSNLGTKHAYDLTVLTATGDEVYYFDIKANDYSGTSLASQGTFLPKGRAYIRLSSSEDDNSWGKTYTLNLSHTSGNVESEFNDDTANADVIKLGTTYSGSSLKSDYWGSDEDYFAVNMPAAGRSTFTFKYPNVGVGNDAYRLTIYDAAGDERYDYGLAGSRGNGSWLATKPISLGKGRSYIRISGDASSPSWGKTYSLNVSAHLTGAPTPKVSGTPKSGSTLKATAGTWAPSGVTLKYQWKRDGKAIAEATKSSYKLTTADAGRKITLTVTGSKAGYKTVSKTSVAKSVALLNFSGTPTPKVSGTPKSGSTLKATAGTWAPSGVTLKYQWKRDGKVIAKATKSSYKLTTVDKRKKITVTVTGFKAGYKTVSKTSAAKTVAK